MERGDAKRRKLDELERFRRKVPHASANALSAVLREAKRSGLPALGTARHHLQEARDAQMGTETEYGPLYQTRPLQPSEDTPRAAPRLAFVHPLALFAFLLLTSANFSSLVEKMYQEQPPTAEKPWNVLLYSDEVTPGNQLNAANHRKIQTIYWSFKEFGHRLSDELFWFTFTAKRSSGLKPISGGMSQLFGTLLKLLFVEEPLELGGASFTLHSGRRIRLFAKL